VSAPQGIRNAGRKASRLAARGLLVNRVKPGTLVQFSDGTRYRVGHRERVPGSEFRTRWVGQELRREEQLR
jgi:hypothetical protein